MFLPKEVVNWAPICDFSLERDDFNYEKQVYVLGFRWKKFVNKPANNNFIVQLDGRKCDGKKFKQIINHHFFYPANITYFSFKDPQGNLNSVSKFCYISLNLRILKTIANILFWNLN